MDSRPAVDSESCGPVIIVFEGREDSPLLTQADRRSGGPLVRFTATP